MLPLTGRPFFPALLLAVLSAQNPAAGETKAPAPCSPAPELEEALASLDPWLGTRACLTEPLCLDGRVERAEALLAEHPEDYFLHRAYQELIELWMGEGREGKLEQLAARYLERAAERPEDASAQLLWARVTSDPEKKRAALLHALQLDPDFPWVHLELVRALAQAGAGTGDEGAREAVEHLERFLALCPEESYHVIPLADLAGDPTWWRARLPALRSTLREAPGREQFRSFFQLWRLEFRLLPPEQQADARVRVREDLIALEALDLTGAFTWWAVLEQGYQTLGDAESLAALRQRAAARSPCSSTAVQGRVNAWMEERGWKDPFSPPQGVPPEQAWESLYRASSEWLAQCPDEIIYSSRRFLAVTRLSDLPPQEVLEEVDRYLAQREMPPRGHWSYPTSYAQAAELLLDRGLAPERVSELARKEIERLREGTARQAASPAPEEASQLQRQLVGILKAEALLTRAHLALKEPAAARQVLGESRERLGELLELEEREAQPLRRPHHRAEAARWWGLRGRLAELENEETDAFAFYRRALALEPQDVFVAQRAKELWAAMGGSGEGWKAMAGGGEGEGLSAASEVGGWRILAEPFPAFELPDTAGRTWHLEDLAGKTVLVNAWATWCAPCRLELPYVQKLHERLKGRSDLAVVTLDSDTNIGLVAPYLEESGFDFPVLLAEPFLRRHFDDIFLPITWILGPDGVVRLEQEGFSSALRDGWVEQTLGRLESIAAEMSTPR